MHSRTTTYRVYSRKQTHLSRWWSSFTVYNNTSWRQNVADIFDILYKYWIFFFFFLSLNLYIYSSVCLLCIFRLPSCRDPHRDGSPRIVLSPTCLGISDWRCDCVIMTQPLWPLCRPQQLFTDPTCYALSLSSLSVSLSLHGVDMAFWMLATNILSLWVICTLFFLVCHLVKDVSWFSTEIYWHSIFIGCKSRLKVIVFNCSIVLLWVCAWVSRWFWRSEAGEFSVSQDFVLKEHSNNFTR